MKSGHFEGGGFDLYREGTKYPSKRDTQMIANVYRGDKLGLLTFELGELLVEHEGAVSQAVVLARFPDVAREDLTKARKRLGAKMIRSAGTGEWWLVTEVRAGHWARMRSLRGA